MPRAGRDAGSPAASREDRPGPAAQGFRGHGSDSDTSPLCRRPSRAPPTSPSGEVRHPCRAGPRSAASQAWICASNGCRHRPPLARRRRRGARGRRDLGGLRATAIGPSAPADHTAAAAGPAARRRRSHRRRRGACRHHRSAGGLRRRPAHAARRPAPPRGGPPAAGRRARRPRRELVAIRHIDFISARSGETLAPTPSRSRHRAPRGAPGQPAAERPDDAVLHPGEGPERGDCWSQPSPRARNPTRKGVAMFHLPHPRAALLMLLVIPLAVTLTPSRGGRRPDRAAAVRRGRRRRRPRPLSPGGGAARQRRLLRPRPEACSARAGPGARRPLRAGFAGRGMTSRGEATIAARASSTTTGEPGTQWAASARAAPRRARFWPGPEVGDRCRRGAAPGLSGTRAAPAAPASHGRRRGRAAAPRLGVRVTASGMTSSMTAPLAGAGGGTWRPLSGRVTGSWRRL